MKLILSLLFTLMIIFNLESKSSDTFNIVITREQTKDNLVTGMIKVNDKLIGITYENDKLKNPAGEYQGVLRYWSGRGFAQGPFGTLGKEGDFFLAVANVFDEDGSKRTDILFHAGNKPYQSKGCILLGPVSREPGSSIPSLDNNHQLRKMRLMFYGTDTPNSTPNKTIKIVIKDGTNNE